MFPYRINRGGRGRLLAPGLFAFTMLMAALLQPVRAQVVVYNYASKPTTVGDGLSAVQETQGKWIFDAQSMRVIKIFAFPKSKTFRREEAVENRQVADGAKKILYIASARNFLDFPGGLNYSSMVGDLGPVTLGGRFGAAQWPKTLKGWVCAQYGKPPRLREGAQSLALDAKQTVFHNDKANTADAAAAEIIASYERSGYAAAP